MFVIIIFAMLYLTLRLHLARAVKLKCKAYFVYITESRKNFTRVSREGKEAPLPLFPDNIFKLKTFVDISANIVYYQMGEIA